MLSIALEKQLEQFESTWDDQASERIEEYLVGLDDSERPEMLSELIMIDLERRYRLGQSQEQVDEQLAVYHGRYPQLFADTTVAKKIDEHRYELLRRVRVPAPVQTSMGGTAPTVQGGNVSSVVGLDLPFEFGEFSLLRMIGRGGMGVVFEAEQRSPRRIVAVKVLNGDISLDAEAVSRFEREMELIASINNPGVVPVLASGCVEGRHFYTMPFYRRGTLRDRMQSGNLAIREATQILLHVTHSVSAVHALKIVHRDLKPGNILFSEDGTSHIADFGLSRHIDHSRSITRTGEIYGTPGYIAPERIGGKNKQIDEFVVDIYSLGAILYEMLCGRPPFRGASAWETLTQAMSDSPVPPTRLNPQVDTDLDAICMKCLELQPKDRYQTCSELASDLENYLAGRPVMAKPPNQIAKGIRFAKRHPAKAGLIVSSLGLLVIGCLAGFLLLKLSNQKHELEIQDLLRRNEEFVANLANASQSMTDRSMGWRGNTLDALQDAADLQIPGRDSSRLRTMVATSTVLHDLEPVATLADGMWCDAVAFDRSGQFVALGQNKDIDGFHVLIYRADDLNAEPHRLWIDCKAENDQRRAANQVKPEDGARVISFSPDGNRLAVGTRHGRVHLYRWNDGQAEWLSTHDPDPGVEAWRLCFSADGETLWTLSDRNKLRIIRDDKVVPFTPLGDTRVGDLVASPTENSLFVRLHSDVVQRYDDERAEPRWQLSNLSRPRDLSLSHDGRFLAISIDTNQRLAVVETDHGLTRKLLSANVTDTNGIFYSHAFGHQNNWIVSVSDDRTVTLWDIAQGRAISSYIVPERGGTPKVTASRTQGLIAVAEHLKVTLYQIVGGEAIETICHQPNIIRNIASDSDGTRLAIVSTAISHIDHDQYMEYVVYDVRQDVSTLRHRSFLVASVEYQEHSPLAFAPDGGAVLAANALYRPIIIPAGKASPVLLSELDMAGGTWIPASDVALVTTRSAPSNEPSPIPDESAGEETISSTQTLRLRSRPNSEFVEDGPWDLGRDVYLVGRCVGHTPPRRVRIDSRSSYSNTHIAELDAAVNEQFAIYIGNHKLKSPRKQLEIEFNVNTPIPGFSLDGVLLVRTRSRKQINEALQADVPPSVSAWLAHSSSGQVWSVWNEEQLLVSDYPSLNTTSLWRNESVSKQAGRGTLSPLLATREWVIAGTTFGEIFVFDAEKRNLVHSGVPLGNRVCGMCQIAGQPLIAVGSSDGEIQVLELPLLKQTQVISVNQQSIDALCFDETRQWLFAGSEDGTISVFRLAQNRFELYFKINLKIGHVQKLIYLPDSDSLAMLIKNETAVRLIRPDRIRDALQKMGLL